LIYMMNDIGLSLVSEPPISDRGGWIPTCQINERKIFDIGCRAARLLAKSDSGIDNNVVIVSRQVAFGYHRHIF
jgi:hypothetical protein